MHARWDRLLLPHSQPMRLVYRVVILLMPTDRDARGQLSMCQGLWQRTGANPWPPWWVLGYLLITRR